MTPQDFIRKWNDSRIKESAGAQSHFNDLCGLLGEKTPIEADSNGEWYAFEKGAMKVGGGDGWADVWKRGCFAWEYKGKGKDLGAALRQLKTYAGSLQNPPLLIVSDMEKIEIHTNWTNMVQETRVFTLEDLLDGAKRGLLKRAFSESGVEEFKPGRKRSDLTKEVAQEFVRLAQNLRERHSAEAVAHFINRLVFCMFAEDVDLLPDKLFKRMLEASLEEPDSFLENASKLFKAMAERNGRLGFARIEWFNGGLFNDDEALPLTREDIKVALRAANQDWSNIDPSIMGTLFERGLDPGKRSQLGAHYTDPDKIMLIVNPVIVEPLTAEWEAAKAQIEDVLAKADDKAAEAALLASQFEGLEEEVRDEHSRSVRNCAYLTSLRTAKSRNLDAVRSELRKASAALSEASSYAIYLNFLERLKDFRVLDPACGSGNFLYLALAALKDWSTALALK